MIKSLDNKEISCVYYQFKSHLDSLNKQLLNKKRLERIDLEIADVEIQPFVIVPISDEEVAAIRSSHYYQTIKAIVDKLQPVVEIIEDSQPEIKSELES